MKRLRDVQFMSCIQEVNIFNGVANWIKSVLLVIFKFMLTDCIDEKITFEQVLGLHGYEHLFFQPGLQNYGSVNYHSL